VRRVFTWAHLETVALPASPGILDVTTIATLLAQEDITIIGAELKVNAGVGVCFIANDGYTGVRAELTPQSSEEKEGSLLSAYGAEVWNTAPASVQIDSGDSKVMFPAGYGIPVKEEGVINLLVRGTNTSAAETGMAVLARIYYVKGIR